MVMTITTDANASERKFGVGFSRLSTTDPTGGRIQYSLWYPTEVSDGVVNVGPFEFPGTRDAEPAVGPMGLAILSHGSGGSDMGRWDTAVALAKAGFVAAALLHPRNNFSNDIGDDQRIVLDGRPRQLSAVIDAILAQEGWSRRIDTKKIAAFGFSAGGYTVLAALGAEPVYSRTLDHCARHAGEDPYCRIINGAGRAARARAYADPAQRAFDGRLRAAVIADPFTAPFSDKALEALPPAKLLFFRPEEENVLKAEFHVSRVVHVLRRRNDFPEPQEILLPGSHHLSFLAPFPESVGKNLASPERFDAAAFHDEMMRRAALHAEMNRTIVMFFKQALAD